MRDQSEDSRNGTVYLRPDRVAERVDEHFYAPEDDLERVREQTRFAAALANHHDREDWADLVSDALDAVESQLDRPSVKAVVDEVESILDPIASTAQSYSVHYVGHAHIDMNWLWDYPETTHTTYRTFSTMFDIMDEYPDFQFTQSQASTYAMMAEHAPEVLDEIRDRIDDGQWEVTANTWVQGDKNMATGESQVRQLLYTNEFVEEELDATPTAVDFEPDTFGHPQPVPKILQDAGVDYYYLGRTGGDVQSDGDGGLDGEVPQLFWWESSDGSRVLAFNGETLWYNGHVDPADVTAVLDFEAETGLRTFLDLYGVGDHGGGPTREDVETIHRMDEWPIFPSTEPSTIDDFFSTVEESDAKDLETVRDELNHVFRGCYSSQTRVKSYNRLLEARLPSVEALAVAADQETDFEYPQSRFRDAWEVTLFNQFHDILPGPGIPETYDHALGQYQEAEATVDLIRDRAFDALCESGSLYYEDADSTEYDDGVPVLFFNPTCRPRRSYVETLVYDYPEKWDLDRLVAVGPDGETRRVQVLETNDDVWDKIGDGEYAQNSLPEPSRLMHDVNFGSQFARVGLTVPDVPAYGYEILSLRQVDGEDVPSLRGSDGGDHEGVSVREHKDGVTVDTDRYRIEADAKSAALASLYDKSLEREFVPDEVLFGVLSVEYESASGSSAWRRGQVRKEDVLDEMWELSVLEDGPVVAKLRWERDYCDTELRVELELARRADELDWSIELDWDERGGEERGVPALRAHFPVAVDDATGTYDVPYGVEQAEPDGLDVPAHGWADLSDAESGAGLTVSNDTTYGHSFEENTLSLTMLRSTTSPDPIPEKGSREIACSLRPHGPGWSSADADHHGRGFARGLLANQLLPGTSLGALPDANSFVAADSEQVAVTSLKAASDGSDVVVRMQELAGEPCEASVDLAWPVADATETDLLERPTDGDVDADADGFVIGLDPHEVRTVRLSLE